MTYVYPTKPRGPVARIFCAPAVFLATLWHHPKLGARYAAYWASAAMRPMQPLS